MDAKQGLLASKSIECLALSFQSIKNVIGSNSLPLCIFSISCSIPNQVLKKDPEHATGLFVDETRYSFHATSTSKTTDGRFGDALDVVTKDSVALGSGLSEAFASNFSTTA